MVEYIGFSLRWIIVSIIKYEHKIKMGKIKIK